MAYPKNAELGLDTIGELPRLRQQRFARCGLLEKRHSGRSIAEAYSGAHPVPRGTLVNFEEMLTGASAFTRLSKRRGA